MNTRGTNVAAKTSPKTSPKTSQASNVDDQERVEEIINNPPTGKTSGESSSKASGKTSAIGKASAKVSGDVQASESKDLSIPEQAQYVSEDTGDELVIEVVELDTAAAMVSELLDVASELQKQASALIRTAQSLLG